ncbi:FeS cluster assembly protein SufD [Aquicella siphonis]|uniref:FeS cluster assembly protein SufD n=1 Tax=Aquicella siphonis TaxID=254247 RepID=A0A5E4PE26_9COXI|nr:Fe-S cluster assembly protein SufD [Aquicella siphonis]VVC74738.1 FeS cluster assembly protein SufD [Aquicella siphonis]
MNVTATIPTWLQKDKTVDSLAHAPEWLNDFRQRHWNAFLKNGLPTRKDERWKYTDLGFLSQQHYSTARRIEPSRLTDVIHQHRLQRCESIMLVLVNGYFMSELSDLSRLPANVIACSVAEALIKQAEQAQTALSRTIDAQKYPFAALNAAMFVDGLFLSVPEDCELDVPVHLLSLVIGEDNLIAHPHHLIALGKNSRLTLVEEYFSLSSQAYMMNVVTSVTLDEHARLQHIKIQQEGRQAVHMANSFVNQKKDSHASFVNFSTGGTFARDDLVIGLREPGADCHTGGFYRLRHENQYIDNHVDIDHAAQRSNSEMLYKGIIDARARAVFNGRLHVERNAQKILAYQANHNLLLSREAEVYSKPELEIYADDVKCKHGATTGQLDHEALFYLRSRGIDRETAVNMLLSGFADEIIQRVEHPGIRLRVQEAI